MSELTGCWEKSWRGCLQINTAKEFIKRRFITKLATRSIPYK